VVERGRGFRFAQETFATIFVTDEIGCEEFQGDGPVEFGVLSPIHHSHSTLTQLFGDSVMRDSLADHGRP